MKLISPISIATGDLTSDVPITETAWTAGTHNLGDQRYVGKDLYEVTADPSTTDEPTAGAALATPSWVLVSQINQWKMFNGALNEQTVKTGGSMDITVESGGVVGALAVLNCEASTVDVTVTDPTDGLVYSREVSLVNNDLVLDIYDYFFSPIDRQTEFVLLDLPPYAGTDVRLVFDAGVGNDTACGVLVLGQQATIGTTYLNFNTRDRFFSRRERSVYGAFLDILSRPVAREATFEVLVGSPAAAQVLRLIQERRDLPTVFVGGEAYTHSIVFGFPDEPEIEQLTQEHVKLNLTVLGQT